MEQLLNFAQPHGAAVEPEFRLAVAVDAALHLNLGGLQLQPAVLVIQPQAHFSKPGRGARGGAGEDHVVQPPDAQAAVRALADHPAQRVHDVRFAGAVGPDDCGQPAVEAQFGAVAERLVAADFDAAEAHQASSSAGWAAADSALRARSAAARWAACLLEPQPSATATPSIRTSTRKRGSCGGPLRASVA